MAGAPLLHDPTGPEGSSGVPLREVEAAIRRRVTDCGHEWFPGVGRNPTVHVRQLVNRPRAVLYAVHLDGSEAPQVLAKLRRDALGGASGGWAGTRPRLAASPLPTTEMVALEYAGLRAIEGMLDPADPHLAAVRPLAHLADEDTILMDHVDGETLRAALVRRSRLRFLGVGVRGRGRDSDDAWRQVGTWLRRYQRAVPTAGLPSRQPTREEVVERFAAYDAFLTDVLGRRTVGEAARRGIELAADALPEQLPLAVGHADFAPRNVFVLADGRLAVFDPMPRWAAPRFEDPATFLVALRSLGIQLHSHGAAFDPGELDRRERLVVEGFLGGEPAFLAAVRCYQMLMMLDRWSALVDAPARGPRGRVQQASVRWASGYLRRELRRVADLVEAHLAGAPGT